MFGTLRITGDHEPALFVEQQQRRPRPPATSQHTACTSCRARKVKCTGEPDGCQRCKASQRACRYTNNAQTRAKASAAAAANAASAPTAAASVDDDVESQPSPPRRSASGTSRSSVTASIRQSTSSASVDQAGSVALSSPEMTPHSWPLAHTTDNMLWEFDAHNQMPEMEMALLDTSSQTSFEGLQHLTIGPSPGYGSVDPGSSFHGHDFDPHMGASVAAPGLTTPMAAQWFASDAAAAAHQTVESHEHLIDGVSIPCNSQAAKFLSMYVPCTPFGSGNSCLLHALRLLSKTEPDAPFWDPASLMGHGIPQSVEMLQALSLCSHCMSQPQFLLVLVNLAKRMRQAFAVITRVLDPGSGSTSILSSMVLSFGSSSGGGGGLTATRAGSGSSSRAGGDLHEVGDPSRPGSGHALPSQQQQQLHPSSAAAAAATATASAVFNVNVTTDDERRALLATLLHFRLRNLHHWLEAIRDHCAEHEWRSYHAECQTLVASLTRLGHALTSVSQPDA